MSKPPIISLLNDDDLYLFNQGSHFRLYEKLGAHLIAGENTGTYFAVWAPDAALQRTILVENPARLYGF